MNIPVLLNDRIISKSEAVISPDDRGYYFGDGVYEVFRIYGGKPFAAKAHMERLQRSADGIRLKLPASPETLMNRLNDLLSESGVREGTLYVQITRGSSPRSHLIPENPEPVLYAYCTELDRPLHNMRHGIAAVTIPDIRWHKCDLKTLNLLPNTLAKQVAKDQGVDEVILHREGRVTECSASNFMMVRDGAILTHPADNWILHGITRQVVLRMARQLGIPVVEEPFTIEDLRHAQEAFITGTTVEITPIIQIDGHPVADGVPGSLTRRLQEAFEQEIQTTL